MNRPVVLVLASGRAERFVASGGSGNKLHARLGDRTVLEHTVAAARASGLPVHVEEAGHEGMGDSIAAAVRATREAVGWLVLPGDLPLVQPASLRAVAAVLRPGAVVVPHYRGRRGHPVAFSSRCLEALLGLHGPQGAQPVVRDQAAAGAVMALEVDDIGIVTDVDTVDDLREAERLWADRSTAGCGPGGGARIGNMD